jgi:DNA-directed RNA polymerase specialized sigma subunit
MQDFSDEERALVKYRFVDGLSQSETAFRLGGKSQMYVSRLERKLLEKLKDRLKDAFS